MRLSCDPVVRHALERQHSNTKARFAETAMVTVLLIGGGGREHAIAWKLGQSDRVKRIVLAPGNGGTTGDKMECVSLDVKDHQVRSATSARSCRITSVVMFITFLVLTCVSHMTKCSEYESCRIT